MSEQVTDKSFSKKIGARVGLTDYERIEKAAQQAGKTVSDFLRECVLERLNGGSFVEAFRTEIRAAAAAIRAENTASLAAMRNEKTEQIEHVRLNVIEAMEIVLDEVAKAKK